MRTVCGVLAAALLLAGCSEQAGPTFALAVPGGLEARVIEGERLVIRARDGRVLLDGLPPAEQAGAPPLVGFAVRDIETRYEMQFGSFKPTDEARGEWRAAQRLADASGPAGAALDLLDGDDRLLARLRFGSSADGHLVIDTEPGAGPERRLSWGFACDAEDHFAGFGAQSWDADHRGQTIPAFVQENGIGKAEHDDYTGAWFVQGRRHSSHLPIPQYLARRGYVLAAHSPHRAIFALCSETETTARIEVEMGARIHVFDGPSPAEALERASAELGRPRMPPRVAFAPWLDAVFGSAEVRRVATKLRDEAIPSSVIWTEDWRGAEWREDSYSLKEEWELDRTLYPDFETLVDELHAAGFHMHVYFNPFVYVGSKAWDETAPHGWLVKRESGEDYTFSGAKFTDTGLLDLFHPDARAWAVDKMRDAIALGADGWMNDYAEWLPTDAVTAAGSGRDVHNLYPVAWQEVAREAIDGVSDGVERLFFARSGWFGTPPLADVIWAGDQRTTLDADDGLPTILPIGIGLGVVGVSTYGHDIAGYQSANNPGSTKEVFFRWTALGAWSPVMRTHHGNQPLKNWTWETDAETTAHFRRYAALHIALVPFFEGLAAHASRTGMPIWRGLALAFPEDAAVWPITDQVMVGSGVLVAPVMQPGASAREVYLPEGRWYPFSGGAAVAGGVTVTAEAPIEEIPVFARAGTVVPMYPEGLMTVVNESPEVPGPSSVGDDRVVLAFLGADGDFEEAGGLAYRIEHLADDAGAATLVWEGEELGPCSAPIAAPCAEGDGTAHVLGPGTLEVRVGAAPVARVVAQGGAGDRALTFRLRR